MKKILLFALLLLIAGSSRATVTFTLVSNPCDTNKVLAIQFATSAPSPYGVYWNGGTYSGGGAYHTTTTLLDTLFNYDGSPVSVTIYQGSSVVDNGTYSGIPSLITFTYAPNVPHCTTSGTASVTVTGGTPPYSYYWHPAYTSTVSATTNPAILPNGEYYVTIVDAAGCIPSAGTYNFDSIISTTNFSLPLTSTDANCTNGTASVTTITPPGAVPPLTLMWSNGATSPSISGLTAGTYVLSATDALGCQAIAGVHIYQLTTINVNTTATPATCLANDGADIGFGSGGTPPYTYLWSNGATTQSQTGLYAGPYNVTVTDAHGCTGTSNSYISASTPITVTYSATPSLCTAPTGTATLAIAGGTPPYTDTFYTVPLQTAVTATNLAPGTYSFHVVDAVGCIQNGSVVVPPIDVLNFNFSNTPAICIAANGSMNVAVTGGVAPLTYAWSTGATTAGITGVPSGYYTVTVTDNNHCVKTKTNFLPYTSPVTVGLSSTPASCIFTHDGTATAHALGGTSPYAYYWTNGGSGATISGLATGPYWVGVTDAVGCTLNYYGNYDYVGYNALDSSCFCTISGTVYYDANGNCVQDAGEPGINNIQIYCSGIGYAYTNALGQYSFIVPAGSYTITQTVLYLYPLAACQVNNIPVTTSAGAGCVHTVDFADAITPIHDVRICTWDYNQPVTGNAYRQKCIVTNNGTVTETNILGGYNTDGQIFSPVFTPSGVFTPGSTYWYNTVGGTGLSLAPGASQTFFMDYTIPTFVPLGTNLLFKDSVAYAAPMTNWLNDYSPWNNVNYFTTQVVASYDPNFIEVTPQGVGTNGNITYSDTTLEYMVHFQNTGTYQAQNIVVIDTLDANLDWTTLRPVYESAPCKVSQTTNGVVTFTFNNINLPTEASNEMTSSGMFTYTIKTKPGLAIGTQFKARASIYFDYNAPVRTGSTLNTLVAGPTKVNTVSATGNEGFTIYPNPTSKTFNAVINSDIANDARMTVSDVTGKQLMTKTVSLQQGTQTITNDVSQLTPGVYFVTFNNHGKVQTQKLVIMK